MAQEHPLTGALALIKVDNQIIGKMKSIRCEETFRRQEIKGIGTLFATEAPVIEWSGSLTCDFFEIKFEDSPLKGAILRKFSNTRSVIGQDSFEDQLLLGDGGITVDIFKKTEDVIDPVTKVIKPKLIPYATITNLLIESESFDIQETSISGRNQRFKYLTPIVYSK